MSPRLPPEMIAHVQLLAEDDTESVAERKLVRSTMDLVCKDWYSVVDHLSHLIIASASDSTRLQSRLRSSRFRSLINTKTKTLSLSLDELDQVRSLNKLSRLLRRLSQLKTLWVQGSFQGHDLRSSGLIKALSTLESFSVLIDCDWYYHNLLLPGRTDILASHSNLRKLEIACAPPYWHVAPLVVDLPSSLTSLSLSVCDPFEHDEHGWSPDVLDGIVKIAPQLVQFDFWAGETLDEDTDVRGILDEVLPKLSSVRRLGFPVQVVTDLFAAIGKLPELVELELEWSLELMPADCDPVEIVTLIDGMSKLRQLTIGGPCYRDGRSTAWSVEQKETIKMAAEHKLIELVWK